MANKALKVGGLLWACSGALCGAAVSQTDAPQYAATAPPPRAAAPPPAAAPASEVGPESEPPSENADPAAHASTHTYFISYSWQNRGHHTSDRASANEIEMHLHRKKRSIERDDHKPPSGKDLVQHILDMIDRSDTFLALVSRDYLDERCNYCSFELKYAFIRKKRIVPILLDGTRLDDVDRRLSRLVWNKGTKPEQREDAVTKIVDSE